MHKTLRHVAAALLLVLIPGVLSAGVYAWDNGVAGSGQYIGVWPSTDYPYWAVGFDSFPAGIESLYVYIQGEAGHSDVGRFEIWNDGGNRPGTLVLNSGDVYITETPGWRRASVSYAATGRFYVAFRVGSGRGRILQYWDNDGNHAPANSQWCNSSGTWVADGTVGDIMIRCYGRRHDAGARRVYQLPAPADSGFPFVPRCSIYNYGEYTEVFPARLKIGSYYNKTTNVVLNPGEWGTPSFPLCTLRAPTGNYPVSCSTELTTDANPVNDRCTTWIAVQSAIKDVGVVALLAPRDTLTYGDVVTPVCSVANFGNAAFTYTVAMHIGTTVLQTTVASHAPGERREVSFPPWTADQSGNLSVRCSTQLTNDRVPGNDRQTGSVYVRSSDVGVTALLAPSGAIESSAAVTPACSVGNPGTNTVSYCVRFKVGAVYEATAAVANHLPGTTRYLTFPALVGVPRGVHSVSCSTELAGDNEPANDRRTGSVTVEVHDHAAQAVVAPVGAVPLNSSVIPRGRFRNSGEVREPVLVMFKINSTPPYSSVRNLGNGLPPGVDTVVNFSSWTATASGQLIARCSVYAPGDRNPANDVRAEPFTVGNADVAVSQIVRPNGVMLPGSVVPQVRTRNLGEMTVSFSVAFTIRKSGMLLYTDSVPVTNLLPGADVAVDFAVVTLDTGHYTTVAKAIFGDANPANDSLAGLVTVAVGSPGWTQLSDMPPGPKGRKVKDGGALAYLDGNIYALKGSNTCEFYCYNIESRSWLTLESIPAVNRLGKKKGVKKGGALTAVAGKVYGTKGNGTLDFWEYNPLTHAWRQVSDVPAGTRALKEGTGLAGVMLGDSAFVYLLKGSATQEFYRCRLSDGMWQARANAPLGPSGKAYKSGSCIAVSGSGAVYALKGSFNELAAYDLHADAWTAKSGMPLIGSSGKKKKAKDGAGMAELGGELFALKGGNTAEFYSYDPGTDVWTQREDVPAGGGRQVKGGGALASSGISLFATKGNSTLEFYRYLPGTTTAARGAFSTEGGAGTESQNRFMQLAVGPNPASGVTTISFALPAAGVYRIRLYDLVGRELRILKEGCGSCGTLTLSIAELRCRSGVYLVKLETTTASATAKLVVD